MDDLNKSILIALFDLAQLDQRASIQELAVCLGQSRRQVACGLAELDRLGLARAETCRLTLRGLARAAASRAAWVRSRRGAHLAA